MRFSRVDHVGIAVSDFDTAVATYTTLHGAAPSKVVTVEAEQVQVAFFPTGETKTELLAPLSDDSSVAKFLAKRGPGLHHICYAVANIDAAVHALTEDGFAPIANSGADGAEGRPIAFFHPKQACGVLIEIIES